MKTDSGGCIRVMTLAIGLALGWGAIAQDTAAQDAAPSGQHASIVVEDGATALEKLAAGELQHYLDALFAVDAPIGAEASKGADHVFRLEVQSGALTEQAILLRPEGDTLLVAGGSPKTLLWAVYELAERWGVRYLVHEDVLPEDPGALRFPDNEVRLEPNMRIRSWRLMNELPHGPVSWSLEENKRFLAQMAKLKYNRMHLSFWPTQPFVDYTFRGMRNPMPQFYFGATFPIDEDTIGRDKLGGMDTFMNPEFKGVTGRDAMVERGIELARSILDEAHGLGMETGISIQPFNWPKEFMEVLPESEPVHQLGNLTAGPGPEQSMVDPELRDMVATIVRAYVETYPQAEYLHVGMPEHRGWTEEAERAYAMLDRKYGLKELGSYEELCARARSRTSFPGGGERVETMLKGDLAALAFFDSLVDERNLLERSDRPDIKLVYNGVVQELFPLLAKMAPEGGEVLSFVDYTASRVLKQRELLAQSPPESLPASLIFTLEDDNVGVLPQLATGSLHELMHILRRNDWSGFYTRYWNVAGLDPAVQYLAQASWDAAATPQSTSRDLIAAVCGPESVEPALGAFQIVEAITKGLDQYGLGFGFPVPGMMTKHYTGGGLSEEIKGDRARYADALAHMRSARQHSRAAGHRLLDYHIGRLQFAVHYLDAADAFGAAGKAERAGNPEVAARHIDTAYEAIREAIASWAAVAQDHGDLGGIALLNEYCYRPIRDKREELMKAAGMSREASDSAATKADAPATPQKPTVRVVQDGESTRTPDECRAVIVGPGVNEPEPFPGYRGFVGWESPIRLQDGTWMVGFSAGYWHASPPTPLQFPEETIEHYVEIGMPADIEAPRGGRAMLTRSTDSGKTWSKPTTLIDTPADDRHPSLLELPDGTLLCTLFTYVGKGDFKANPSLAHRTILLRSEDGGRTWQRTDDPLPSPFLADETNGPMALADDGSVLMIINGMPQDGGPQEAALLRSVDKGKTWELVSTIAADHDLLEPTVAQLPDGRLVMAARPEGDIAWSSDGGKTWTPPVTFGMRLYAPSLYVLEDETLVLLHGSYNAGGLRVIFSRDGGKSWIAPAKGHGFLVDNSYGYGKATELPDGSLFITYLKTGGHATDDASSNAVLGIRLKIREDYSGIELLPAPNREDTKE